MNWHDSDAVLVFTLFNLEAVNGDHDALGINWARFPCTYSLNSVKYSLLWNGEVGRVNVPAGELIINNSGGKEPTKVIT